jgi:hypothetical protein
MRSWSAPSRMLKRCDPSGTGRATAAKVSLLRCAGVTLFEVQQDQIVAGRLYLEEVVEDDAGIDDVVQELSGSRPQDVGTWQRETRGSTISRPLPNQS